MTPIEMLAELIQGNYPTADIVPHACVATKMEIFAGPGKWVTVEYNSASKTFYVTDAAGKSAGNIDGAFLLVRELLDEGGGR